jgi:hypothetical protein
VRAEIQQTAVGLSEEAEAIRDEVEAIEAAARVW